MFNNKKNPQNAKKDLMIGKLTLKLNVYLSQGMPRQPCTKIFCAKTIALKKSSVMIIKISEVKKPNK